MSDAGKVAPIDAGLRQRFLSGMSHAAATVNVVTTDGPAGRAGVTVSAMTSVTADLPKPALLVCVHQMSSAAEAILGNGVFCVNVLRDDQSAISDAFAGRLKTLSGDKFDSAVWTTQVTGAPRVVDPLVAFDCRTLSSEKVGTHWVFLGAVEDIFEAAEGSPLIYANRAYGTPARLEAPLAGLLPVADRGAPEALRLGAFHTFGPYIVPEVVARLSAAGHNIDLRLLEGDQRRVVQALREGTVDLALVHDFGLGEGLVAEELDELHPYVLLAESDPLAFETALSLQRLAEEPLVLLDAPPSGDYVLSLFGERDIEPRIRFRSASFEMVRGLVGHGLGYSLLATKPASTMSYDGRSLVTRPLSDPVPASPLVLATRAATELPAAAAAFAAECRNLFDRSGH